MEITNRTESCPGEEWDGIWIVTMNDGSKLKACARSEAEAIISIDDQYGDADCYAISARLKS